MNWYLFSSAISNNKSSPETTPRMMNCITVFSISCPVSSNMTRKQRLTLLHRPFTNLRIVNADFSVWMLYKEVLCNFNLMSHKVHLVNHWQCSHGATIIKMIKDFKQVLGRSDTYILNSKQQMLYSLTVNIQGFTQLLIYCVRQVQRYFSHIVIHQ